MAQDPLANLMTLPDLGNIQNSNQPLVREMPQVNEGITYNPTPVYTPYIPNGAPDAVNINEHIVGNEQDGPNPGAKKKDNGTMDFVKSVNNYIGQADTWAKDEYKYGRAYSYGAGWKNSNYERYYSSPQFKNLGFSPYRNNEAVYNDKSSWWDDFNRMRGQWMGLAWNGVKSAGVGELFGSADDSADSFEKAMSVGSSTQKGVGAFMTNLTLNSAYTLGIMGEIAVENIALGVLDVATFGGSGALHGAALAKQAFSAGKLFEGIKGTYSFLKQLKNAEKAREFYNATKAGDTAINFAKWANPLQHTTEFVTNLAKNTSSFDKLGSMAKTAKGFSSFYKDLREIELAHSEAKMEGATGSHEYHQQLIDEYYDKNGMMPDGQAAQDIYDRSQSVRTGVTLANDFVIYGSNKIAFGKLLNGFNPVGAVTRELGQASLRNIGKVAAKDVLTKGAIEATELTLGKKVGNFLTSSAYVPWSRTYLAGNLAEALQENAQDVIQDYQKARHDRLDQDPTQAGYWSAMNDLGGALGKQWSGQGLETFMSGFLMGSIAGGAQGVLMGGFQKIQEFKNKDQFDQAKVQRQEHENAIVNAVNSLAKDGINYGQHNAERVATVKNLADEQDKAADNNNAYNFNNNKDELATEHFHTLESNGKMGLFTEHLDDMLSLKDGELAEAYNKPVAEARQVRKRLNDLKDRSEQYSLDYKAVNDEFVNPHNPSMFNPKKNPELYREVKLDYDAHNEAVKQLLFSITASKRVAGRMVSTFDDVVNSSPWLNVRQGAKALTNAAGADVSLLLDNFQRESETETLKDEIEALNQGTPAQKAQAKIKQQKLNMLEAWAGSLSNFNKEINSQTRSLTEEQKAANINKSKVREGAVIKEAGKDVEYKVKKVIGNTAVVEDKDGKTLNIDRDNAVIVKESTKAAIYEEGDTLTEAISMLEDSFNEYAKYLAKTKGGVIMDKELKKTFDKIKDFYILERDSQKFVQAINALNNPEYFSRYADISKRSDAIRKEQYTANMLESYNKFIKLMDDNKFLNDLFDIGVFIMPEDVETYKTKPRDVTFYDTVNKETVKRDSDKYKKIITVIEKYEKSAGIVTAPVKPAAPAEVVKPSTTTTATPKDTPVPTTKTPITPTTPVAEIAKLGTLKDKLIAAYKKAGEEKDSKLQMLGGTDEEIMATNTFKEFLQSNSVIKMMDAFNQATGRTPRTTAPAEVIVPNTPVIESVSDIDVKAEAVGKKLDALTENFVKAGKTQKEAETLALQSITEEERQILRDSYNAEKESSKTSASDIEAKKQKIFDLRAKEQAEYAAMSDPNNAVEKQKIYDRYDKLLTPLLNEVKADIKARREEDLEKTNAQLETIEKNGDSFIRVKVEVYTTLSNEETLDEVEIITFKDGSRKFRRRDGKTGELILDEKIKKENTTTNEQFIESWVGNLDNSLKKISEDNNPNKTAIDKINAKYDAELAALKNKPAIATPATPIDRKTEINNLLKKIKSASIGYASQIAPGTTRWTKDGIKVTLVKSQRDKYNRGNEVYEITYPNGKTESINVDWKQRPTNGWSDSKEIPFKTEYSENPLPLLDELAALEKQPVVKTEPGVQAEILFEEVPETEQVTDAEFNEVLRLAAFFVENPKEPGTVGDAASKFPKLYQVLKALEQERYDAIEALNDKPDGTSSMPRKALARTKNKIVATYDKQIDTLRPGYDPNKGLTEVDGILVPDFMAKQFADVFTLQDLENLLMEKLTDFSLGLDTEYIGALRIRLTQELMKKISFDIIEQGNIIIDEKGQAFYVTKKTKNQIKLRSFDLQKMTLGTEEKTVTKATLAKKVKNIYSKNMEVIGTTENVTPEETQESKDLIKDLASNSETEEASKKIVEAIKTTDLEEIKNKLKNASNNCKGQ